MGFDWCFFPGLLLWVRRRGGRAVALNTDRTDHAKRHTPNITLILYLDMLMPKCSIIIRPPAGGTRTAARLPGEL